MSCFIWMFQDKALEMTLDKALEKCDKVRKA